MKQQFQNISNSILAIILCSTMAQAQTKNSLQVQYMGAGNTIGLSYERDLTQNERYTIAATIGFQRATFEDCKTIEHDSNWGTTGDLLADVIIDTWADFISDEEITDTYKTNSIPLGLSFTVGNTHQIEGGAGLSFNSVTHTKTSSKRGILIDNKQEKNAKMFTNIGYRFQSDTGIMLRLGLANVYLQDKAKLSPTMYVGAGYEF